MRVIQNHVATNVVLPLEQKRRLEALAKKTRITQSEYLREAVRDLLAKYEQVLGEEPPKAGKRAAADGRTCSGKGARKV